MTGVEYEAKGQRGFEVRLSTESGHLMVVSGEFDQDDLRQVSGDDALVHNPAVVANLWGYASHEHQFRRARAKEKRKHHSDQAKTHYKTTVFVADLVVRGEAGVGLGLCSGCFTKSDHGRVAGAGLPTYICRTCGGPTVRCAVPRCSNYASRGFGRVRGPLYCAEHRHEVASFAHMDSRLASLDEYEDWLRFDKKNVRNATRTAALAVVGGAVVGPFALASASAIGGAVGAMSGLTGAAATSHGLATIGFGSLAAGGLGMAGGTAIITATGAALGGAMGAVTTAAYVGSDKSFKIVKLRDGVGAPVILASGFLTEGTGHWGTWRRLIDDRFPEHPVYRVHWGNKELKAFGKLVGSGSGTQIARRLAESAAKRAAQGASLGPLSGVLTAFGMGANPWSVAKNRAAMTGTVLADLIARSDEGPYILVGHSLGARVMATTAEILIHHEERE